MPYVRAVGLLACALALAGCGLGRESGPREITGDELAVMVLPQGEFGAEFAAFQVDDDSGPGNARRLADNTMDPNDTPASLKQAGWTAGYDLNYSTTKRLAVGGHRGAVSAGTSADLFVTETDARAFILVQMRQFERSEGKTREGVKLLRAEEFDVTVGDEGWGVELEFRAGDVRMRSTGVIFRHGRLVATAFHLRGDGVDARPQTASLALKLENRIARVLAGDLDAQPVALPLPAREKPLPKPTQLARMTLGLEDLPPGARLADEGRWTAGPDSVSYFRTFDVERTMIGGSHLQMVRAETRVYATDKAAAAGLRAAASAAGRSLFARTLVRSFARLTGATAQNVEVMALPRPGADAAGFTVTFDLPSGRFKTATMFVRSGRSLANVTGFCRAHSVNPDDMRPLAATARDRLV